jgi:membrane protein
MAFAKQLRMKKFSFGLVWQSLKQSFKGFSEDKITKLSASLAYYTVFSIGPLLFLIIFIAGLALGKEAIQGNVYNQLDHLIGADAAKQVQDILKGVSLSGKGGLAVVIGVITLLIGATSVFAEMQDSINSIWGVKQKPSAGIWQTIKSRLLSFGLIGSLAFLLLVSLAVTAVISGIGDRIQRMVPGLGVVLFEIINAIISIGITSLLFAIIFKVLPDIKTAWKNIWPGAIFTSLLFLLGKYGISAYISSSEVGTTYGAAGSLVILLLWVYYSSIILYFGAEFTKFYALDKGAKVTPEPYAEWNAQPAVAGAKATGFKEKKKERSSSSGRQPAPEPHWSYAKVQVDKQGKSTGPGMGTTILGLALYLFNTSKPRGK